MAATLSGWFLPRCALRCIYFCLPRADASHHTVCGYSPLIMPCDRLFAEECCEMGGRHQGAIRGRARFSKIFLPAMHPRAAAGRCKRQLGAARRRQTRLWRRSSAAATIGWLGPLACTFSPGPGIALQLEFCVSLARGASRAAAKKCGALFASIACQRALWLIAPVDLNYSWRALSNDIGVCRGPA